jgi:hypothetical protein
VIDGERRRGFGVDADDTRRFVARIAACGVARQREVRKGRAQAGNDLGDRVGTDRSGRGEWVVVGVLVGDVVREVRQSAAVPDLGREAGDEGGGGLRLPVDLCRDRRPMGQRQFGADCREGGNGQADQEAKGSGRRARPASARVGQMRRGGPRLAGTCAVHRRLARAPPLR